MPVIKRKKLLGQSSPVGATLHKYLKELNADVPEKYITSQIQSHPLRNSIVCITDTLDELGIENVAVEVDEASLAELPTPFLAYTKDEKRELLLIDDVQEIKENYPDFSNIWTGKIIVSEENPVVHFPDLKIFREQEQYQRVILYTLLVIFLSGIILFFSGIHTALIYILTVTSLAGLFTGILIQIKNWGGKSFITDKLCGTKGENDCSTVINSDASRIFSWLGLSDVVIIYFTIQLLALLTGTVNLSGIVQCIAITTILSIPITLFSLYYQFTHRHFCILCLFIVAILWCQFAVLFYYRNEVITAANHISQGIVYYLYVAALVNMGWLLLVKYRQLSKKQDELSTSFLKFKRSPELLINALNNQQPNDVPPFKNELLLGNPKATLQLVIACAPFCEPCARVHKMLHALLKKQPLAFGMSIRFTHSEEDKHIPKGEAVIYILQTIHAHVAAINDQDEKSIVTGKILHDWYTLMNLQAFRQLYPLQKKVDISELLEEHITWWKKAKIMYTPTVFVNGYTIPAPYNIYDAAIIFPILSEYLGIKRSK
jgi:hypothetical protein